MKIATCELESISPYSQSAPVRSIRGDNEAFEEFELRTWRERISEDASGMVYIPAMAFKNALSDVARYLSIKVKGKGHATYSKHFDAGLIIAENVPLNIPAKTVASEKLFVPSDGKRGSGKRVWKFFPVIPAWRGTLVVHVLDDMITEDIFERHLDQAGRFVGVGRFRPQRNGFYGRFQVKSVRWEVV